MKTYQTSSNDVIYLEFYTTVKVF